MTNIEDIFNKKEWYFHCCLHGGIYRIDNKDKQIYQLKKDQEGKYTIPDILDDYKITSGYCKKCYSKEMKKIEKLIEDGKCQKYT